MDTAIEHLAKAFPLITPEWTEWTRRVAAANLGGTWALTG